MSIESPETSCSPPVPPPPPPSRLRAPLRACPEWETNGDTVAPNAVISATFQTNRDLTHEVILRNDAGSTVGTVTNSPLTPTGSPLKGTVGVTFPGTTGNYYLHVRVPNSTIDYTHTIEFVVETPTPTAVVSFRFEEDNVGTVHFYGTFSGGNGTYVYFVQPDTNSPTLLPGGTTNSTSEVLVGSYVYPSGAGTYTAKLSVSAGNPIPVESSITVVVT